MRLPKEKLLLLSWKEFGVYMSGILELRKASKIKILKAGSEQSLSHSEDDIKNIDSALLKIKNNYYGICGECGGPIERDRLIIIPESPFCIDCAKKRKGEMN